MFFCNFAPTKRKKSMWLYPKYGSTYNIYKVYGLPYEIIYNMG